MKTLILTNSARRHRQIKLSCNRGLTKKPFLRKMLAVALMSASLAFFLCASGRVSYGGSPNLRRPRVTVDTNYYRTFGTPNDALVTDDDANVLVSVSNPTGVQVFRKPDFTNPCGGQQILSLPPPRPQQPVQSVDGMQFFPGSPQVSVAAAVEARGAEFFRLASLNEPCAVDGVVNVQQYPAIPNCGNTFCPPGTFDIAVTPDGQYAFVANEYGVMPNGLNMGLGGTVGIIRVQRDNLGRFTPRTFPIGGNRTIYIPGGSTIPGITMSHDGRYLYVTCEGSADGINPDTSEPYRDPTDVANTPNGTVLCPGCLTNFKRCDNESKGGLVNNGLLTVIDVDKAIRGMGQAAIITTIASGCSPVRAVETTDGQYIWVAARGLNKELPVERGTAGYQVLAFDVSKLVSGNSQNDALVGYGDSGGTAPVGMALFGNNDSLLAVANSNRFYNNIECVNPPPGSPPCTASVAILDVSNPAAPAAQQIIPNANDAFPRNVTLGPDGSTLYVPNANAKLLEVITTTAN